jgi:hypothetical protein
MQVTHDKHGKSGMPFDGPTTPTPFDAYHYGAVGSSSAAAGTVGVVAGPPSTSEVRRRNPPSSEGSYPNPWSVHSASNEGRPSSPLVPTTEGSVYSGTAMSTADYVNAQRPLRVQNPSPGPSIPMVDLKDRTVFLSADQGYRVFDGQSSASGTASGPASAPSHGMPAGPSSSSHTTSFSAPFVHQDGGSFSPPRRTKAAEAQDGATGAVDAPPAYEE